jgi:hypothetical protein
MQAATQLMLEEQVRRAFAEQGIRPEPLAVDVTGSMVNVSGPLKVRGGMLGRLLGRTAARNDETAARLKAIERSFAAQRCISHLRLDFQNWRKVDGRWEPRR